MYSAKYNACTIKYINSTAFFKFVTPKNSAAFHLILSIYHDYHNELCTRTNISLTKIFVKKKIFNSKMEMSEINFYSCC